MSRILITGGLGFVGGRLAKGLSANHSIILSSRKEMATGALSLHGADAAVHHHSLLSKESFPRNIETVIHLAALNEWDCVQYPSDAIRVNIDETRIILENSIAAGVSNFIYFSTAHVYRSPLQGTVRETDLPAPAHPYAITHRAAEDYVLAATVQKKINGLVIRLSNSFGAPVSPDVNRWTLLANDLARQAIEKKKLVLLSNGCQYRDFVCLSDVVQIISNIIKRGPQHLRHRVYNLGAGVSMRVIDMAKLIADTYQSVFNHTVPVELPANATPTEEPALVYSIERLHEEGWQVQHAIEEEIKQLLLFCSQHFKPQ